MGLPSCLSGTYSNDKDVQDVCLFGCILKYIANYKKKHRTYFVGLCYYCNKSVFSSIIICSGCQLVSYCRAYCQEKDWCHGHRYVCKAFPMANGKNVLYTKDPWKDHISSLRERAARLPSHWKSLIPLFRNPPVCNTCRESNFEKLQICECFCVSYCSLRCEKTDKTHAEYCKNLGLIFLSTNFHHRYISLEEDTVSENFTPTFKWSDLIPHKRSLDLLKSMKKDMFMGVSYSLALERLSYPMSLMFALQTLPHCRMGQYCHLLHIEEQTTLSVHVVTSSPLFDSKPWEIFMHRLPKLKQLNVVFIIQGKSYKEPFTLNFYGMGLKRCKDCGDKDRVITYSVHKMIYHMFFSSPFYTEPDVVVIYGNTDEMSLDGGDSTHSDISYNNMIYSRNTVLVLTDATEDLVNQGIRAVNAVQPIIQLVPTQINPLRGFSSNRADIDSVAAIINEKQFFACLRRK